MIFVVLLQKNTHEAAGQEMQTISPQHTEVKLALISMHTLHKSLLLPTLFLSLCLSVSLSHKHTKTERWETQKCLEKLVPLN